MLSLIATSVIDFDTSQGIAPAWSRDRAQATMSAWARSRLLPAPVRYAAGARIAHPESGAWNMCLLERGLVGLERAHNSGPQRNLFALCLPGQLFNQSGEVSERESYTAVALTPCIVYPIGSFRIMEALLKGGDGALFVMRQYSENLLRAGARATEACLKPAKVRFEFLLSELAAVIDSRTLTGSIGLPLKDKDIASLLGISPGQLSVIKKQMSGAKIISYSQRRNELLMRSVKGTLRFCKVKVAAPARRLRATRRNQDVPQAPDGVSAMKRMTAQAGVTIAGYSNGVCNFSREERV